jgi:ectoine hydroxylase-related dioxygenase (phytanoyl-CoA dioxygenase family)
LPSLQEAEELPGDYVSSSSDGAGWSVASDMRGGDLLLFNAKTVHAATVQANDRTRLSIDTRVTTCRRRGPMPEQC